MLHPGVVGVRRSMVTPLQPCINMSTPPPPRRRRDLYTIPGRNVSPSTAPGSSTPTTPQMIAEQARETAEKTEGHFVPSFFNNQVTHHTRPNNPTGTSQARAPRSARGGTFKLLLLLILLLLLLLLLLFLTLRANALPPPRST